MGRAGGSRGIAFEIVETVIVMSEPERTIESEQQGDVTIVRFTRNQISADAYTNQATDELKKLGLSVGGKVLVSLRNVRFMSSGGIAALVLFNKLLRSVRGHLKICDVQPLIRQVFAAGGFEKAFDLHGTKKEALEAFGRMPSQEKAM